MTLQQFDLAFDRAKEALDLRVLPLWEMEMRSKSVPPRDGPRDEHLDLQLAYRAPDDYCGRAWLREMGVDCPEPEEEEGLGP